LHVAARPIPHEFEEAPATFSRDSEEARLENAVRARCQACEERTAGAASAFEESEAFRGKLALARGQAPREVGAIGQTRAHGRDGEG
jgi:hypothetical protein